MSTLRQATDSLTKPPSVDEEVSGRDRPETEGRDRAGLMLCAGGVNPPVGGRGPRKGLADQQVGPVAEQAERLVHPCLAAAAEHDVRVEMEDVVVDRLVPSPEVSVERSSPIGLRRNRAAKEEGVTQGSRGIRAVVDDPTMSVRVFRAATIDEIEQALTVSFPRAIGATGDRKQVDNTENLADLRGPGPELVG
jgi:hypothetical protein